MVARKIANLARERFERYPVLTVTGPRQSGKTTLCRAAFPHLPYTNLEDPDARDRAVDPNAFLARFPDGAILDEVQRAPELVSAVQVLVDARARNGQFVLSGSHNFQLHRAISQSLAGRTSVLDLLPLSFAEVRQFGGAAPRLDEALLWGGYPRIYDQHLPAAEFLADYVRTYVERDVRLVLNVGDLVAFQTFLRLCAGRSSQLVNLSALASDCGITHNTAKAWLSVLEASYLVQRVAPWHRNLGKRLVKTPKLYFLDCGLLCWLLGIRTVEQLESHPLRGAIFETFAVTEVWKARLNRGVREPVWFYRDRTGREVDLVIERGDETLLLEIKSGRRVATDATLAVDQVATLLSNDPTLPQGCRRVIVYGGDECETRRGVELVAWHGIDTFVWT